MWVLASSRSHEQVRYAIEACWLRKLLQTFLKMISQAAIPFKSGHKLQFLVLEDAFFPMLLARLLNGLVNEIGFAKQESTYSKLETQAK